MKQNQLIAFFFFIIMTSCSNETEDLLYQTRNNILSKNSIAYQQQALYPNPVGKVDTIEISANFNRNEKSLIGHNFILKSKNADYVSLDGTFKIVDHHTKNVKLFHENEPEKLISYIKGINNIMYSPLTLMKENNWIKIGDTTTMGKNLVDYYRVESDAVIDGNKIYTEQHIFLNSDSKLLERWERRNFFKEKLSQTVVYNYSDYVLDKSEVQLTYDFPSNYYSVLFGKDNNRTPLEVGQKAPLFSSKDLQGRPLYLEKYLGQKIILNFSSIGCGYSHEALQYINQNDILSSDEYSSFYLSMWDKREEVDDYFKKVKSQFLVIPNAEEIANIYGVSSTPTFFLIDENGIIEKMNIGNDKEFLNSLKR